MSPSRRRAIPAAVLLGLFGAAGWFGWEQVAAAVSVRRGRAALDRGDSSAARHHLARALGVWPDDAEAHFLAARAARRDGDPKAAVDHLKQAHRLGWPDDAVGPELVLADLRAGTANEPALLRLVADGHPESADILAVLVAGYLAAFRVAEADPLSARWVELAPDSAAAWGRRSDVLERLRKRNEAREAAREAARLAPDDRAARLRFARLVLETRQPPDEAAALLEPLHAANPADAEPRVLLAAARHAQGRTDDALALLAPLTSGPEPDAKALYLRGRLLLEAGRPADALPALRRAAERDRSDPEVLFTLFQCLQQTGPPDEATAAEQRWKQTAADLTRVSELGRAIANAPADPDLRREMGELFLRNGREADGVRWLESALKVRPDHPPAHRLLADHYSRTGRPDLAAPHRAAAGGR